MSTLSGILRKSVTLGATCLASFVSYGDVSFATQGGEYAVIGRLPGDQGLPQAAINRNGGYLVWHDNATDGDGLGISAQRLDSSLSGTYGTFRVNEHGVGEQQNASVTLLKDGGAVFVWQGGSGGFTKIYARFLSANGTFVTGDVQVSASSGNQEILPTVITLSNGNVVIAWSSFGQEKVGGQVVAQGLQGVFAQIFTPAGTRVGQEFQVNQTTLYNQRTPALAALQNGSFIATWISESKVGLIKNLDPNGVVSDQGGLIEAFDVAVYGRIFGSDGQASGNEFRISSQGIVSANPSVAVSSQGITVVWTGKPANVVVLPSQSDGWDIYGRTLNFDGTPIAPDAKVNANTFGDQIAPKISVLGATQFVVWTSLVGDGSGKAVLGRLLGLNGQPLTREFRVNSNVVGPQIDPAVSSDSESRYFVAWSSYPGGPESFDIFAQRYAISDTLPAPPAPSVSALSQTKLNVAWPELAGFNVSNYQLYVDSVSQAVVVTNNYFTVGNLQPGSSHAFRLAYTLADGRSSAISGSVSGSTWGEDDNFDGLPDDWQASFWGADKSKWPSAASDSDGDGATNLQEFLAGTNPIDSNSVLRTQISSSSQGWRLNWNCEPGCIYQVQVSKDLSSWSDVGAPRFAAGRQDSLPVDGQDGVTVYRVVRVR